MNALIGALCIGHERLFDSTDGADHLLASRLCADCPVIAACQDTLAGQRAPEGTWAGQLLAPRATARLRREEAAFSEDEARRAHAAHARGDESAWAEMGERVYQRRRARNRKGGRAA